MYFSPCFCFLQFVRQVEAAKRQAEGEQKEYDELLKWLDQADEILKIVDQPLRDRNKEYKVRMTDSQHPVRNQDHFCHQSLGNSREV